jgi:phosphomannomutase
MVRDLVVGTLLGSGFEVIDLGLATTPTVELAVPGERADGGIILTASHNPKQWNALKLLNESGEFISAEDGAEVLPLQKLIVRIRSEVDDLRSVKEVSGWTRKHIDAILALDLVDPDRDQECPLPRGGRCREFGGWQGVPALLTALGVGEVVEIHCTPNGEFPHNPEPLA